MPVFSLSVEVESLVVLPLGLLHADQNFWNPGSHGGAVSRSQHCDGKNTMEIPACIVFSLPPICVKAAGQALQRGLRFCSQNGFDRYDEW